MAKQFLKLWIGFALLAFALTPSIGFADPIGSGAFRIASGTVEFDWTDIFTGWSVAGPGFSLELGAQPPGFPDLTIRDGLVNPSFEGRSRIGRALIRLPSRTVDSGLDPPWTLSLRLDAELSSPQFFEDASFHVSFPFNLTASVAGFDDGGAFHYNFTGTGSGFIFAAPSGRAHFGSLDFDDAAPVPEASTLLLAGIASFGALTRRKRFERGSR